MAVNTDAASAAQRWVNGMGAAGTKVTAGVQRVSTAPGAAAARQQQVYASQVAANAGKWARKVAAVSLASWQEATITKGIPRLASGANAAEAKMASFMSSFLPVLSASVGSLPSRGTYEQNKARSIALMDALHAKAGSFSR